MADHEMDLRGGIPTWELRCICEPGTVIGKFLYHSSAKAAFTGHLKTKDVKPPVDHQIRLSDHLVLPGYHCGCSCGEDLGEFSNETSAIRAWRNHSKK